MYCVELVLGADDRRHVLVEVAVEDAEDVGGPAENSFQSSLGAPNSSQMIGIGYGSQKSTAMSASPVSVKASMRLVDHRAHVWPQRIGVAGRERRADEPAESCVFVAFR